MARVTLASYENDKRLGAHFPKGVLMPYTPGLLFARVHQSRGIEGAASFA